jgi:hypothetical protein
MKYLYYACFHLLRISPLDQPYICTVPHLNGIPKSLTRHNHILNSNFADGASCKYEDASVTCWQESRLCTIRCN